MNLRRRNVIKKNIETLEIIKQNIDMLLSEEQRCFDGLLEHLQESSKGEKMQDCMSQLEDAMDLIDQVIDSLEEAAL